MSAPTHQILLGYTPPSQYATLNGTTAQVTMSNGNLTATHNSTVSNAGATSTSTKTTGSWYFEAVFTTTHGTADCVATALAGATFGNIVTNGTNCVACYASGGAIWSNNANSTKSLGTIVSGDTIGFAIDLTNRLAWFRKLHSGSAGNWNGDVSANPATGTGGVTVAATVAANPFVGFGGGSTATNDQITTDFGTTPFAMTIPSGFNGWTL